jgi:hypothetical protein
MNALLCLLPMLLVWIVGSFFGLGPVRARKEKQ